MYVSVSPSFKHDDGPHKCIRKKYAIEEIKEM